MPACDVATSNIQTHSFTISRLYVYSLYQKIDTEKLQCLNEAEEGSGRTVFKPWDERLDRTKVYTARGNRYCIGSLLIVCVTTVERLGSVLTV